MELKVYPFVRRAIPALCVFVSALLVLPSFIRAQQFTAGRLVVERVGTGSTTPSSAATPVFLDEYTITGTPGVTIAIPTVTSGSVNRATESGTATSDAMINRSVDGKYLLVPGYDAAVGTAGVVSTNSNKVITRVDPNGGMASSVLFDATTYSAKNFRCIASVDGSAYWISGDGNGPIYLLHQGSTTPVSGTEISTTVVNNRNIAIFGGQLYQGTGSGSTRGVYTVGSGLPTTTGNVMTNIVNLGSSGDPYGFIILNVGGTQVMYLSDNNNRYLYKYHYSSGSWVPAGYATITVGGTSTGFYGLTGSVSGSVVTLYATTVTTTGTTGRIVSFTDASGATTSLSGAIASTTIVGPTGNTALHGITFVPFSVTGIAATTTSVCTGSGTTITISGNPNTSVTYQVAGVTQPAVTITGTGSYTFSTGPLTANTTFTVISATDGMITQTYTNNVTVSVNPLPSVSGGAGAAVCPGSPASLTATGALSYTWAPGATLSATTGPGVTATPTATTTYTVTGTDANGCMNTGMVTVTVNTLPTISAGPGAAICTGLSTPLHATGAVTYTWSPATGLSATTGASVTAGPSGTTTYSITGTDASGCVNTGTVTVSVNTAPAVSAGPNVGICNGSSTPLTATGAITYTWSPATGLSATTGSTVTASPSSTHTYTVTGSNGCTNTASVTVSVNALPSVSCGPGSAICNGASAALSASGAATYVWSPSSTLSSSVGSGVTATPTSTTTYTVVGTDGNGCTNHASVTVTVNALPVISAGSGVAICNGASTVLTATGATTYSWAGAGLSATTGSTVTASPSSTTTYTISGTNSSGCTGTGMVTVTVNSLPTVSAGSGVAVCNGSSASLTATGAITYSWSPSTGLSATTGASVTATPSSTTTYTVTGSNGCIGRASVTVTVNSAPVIVSAGATICNGSSAPLSASGAVSYTWVPATGLSSTVGSSVSANPAATTTYTITGTDALGCIGHTAVTVAVNSLPVIVVGPGIGLCNGSSATLSAGGASVYSWSPATGLSATTGSSVVASPTVSVTYTVTGVSTAGCVSSASKAVSVNAVPTAFAVTGGGIFCGGGAGVVVGLAGSQAGVRYQLYVSLSGTGSPIAGTGGALSFGPQTTGGLYTAIGTDTATGCHTRMLDTVSLTISPGPAIVAVTGGGAYCADSPGAHVGLTGSAIGVNYQLYHDSVATGSPVAGLGYALDFGPQTLPGTYTVVATFAGSSCSSNMHGAVTVSINPLPSVYTVTGGGTICKGETGAHIGISNSQIGAHYQVYFAGAPVGASSIGMNTPLDFGLFTEGGVYTVEGISSTTGCISNMTGNAVITVDTLPVITGPRHVSPGTSITLAGSPAGGVWSSDANAIATAGSISGVVAGVAFGYADIKYTISTGCYAIRTVSVTPDAVSVPSVNALSGISIIPNPNNGSFVIQGSLPGAADAEISIQLTDLLGRPLFTRKAKAVAGNVNEHIELQDLAPGTYIISLHTAAESASLRFVKEQ